MSIEAPILDSDVEEEVLEILKICGTNMASISVRYMQVGTGTSLVEQGYRTLKRKEGAEMQGYTITSSGEHVFHIASLTKILVAVAVFIAIEVRAKEDVPDNPYANFRDIQDKSLTFLWNKYNPTKIGGLPGDPTLYNLIVHNKGITSANHRLLAPDGTPIMSVAEMIEDLIRPIAHHAAHVDLNETWTSYSNVNYAAIAMTIEALWCRSFESFMHETLFDPLSMNFTSIGSPREGKIGGSPWVVDCEGNSHPINEPGYRSNGVEAGALGAYSTAKDLDIFFEFLLNSFHGTTNSHDSKTIPGFDLDILGKILLMANKQTKTLRFTPLGLYVPLDSSLVGSQSSNRLQFPDSLFSTYPVLPKSLAKESFTYHMVGSSIGCACATAFYPSLQKGNYAIVVLTDTSGPVDSADHILRLLLRRTVGLDYSHQTCLSLRQPQNIGKMVTQAMNMTMQKWQQIRQSDIKLLENCPRVDRDIIGVFKGVGFSQQFHIYASHNGRTCLQVSGSSTDSISRPFDLAWINESRVKICVPPHLSIDCLGDGQWSDLNLVVYSEGDLVTKLMRKTALGWDCYLRDT